MYRTLVSTDDLFRHLHNPDWVVFDCRFAVGKPEQGRQAYLTSHIPGARYADLDQDLSSPSTAESGRHPLPEPAAISEKLRDWGVDDDSQIVVYDEASGALAGRLWWLMRWLGHDAVALLDGGFSKWLSEDREIQSGGFQADKKGNFEAAVRDDMWVSVADLEQLLGREDVAVLDARSAERYSGDKESVDPEGGHIPSSVNRPLTDNLDENNCFLPPEKLREIFAPVQKPTTIHSCGSGVTACHNLLAMEIAGFSPSKLYVGSWSEWIKSPDRPRAKGSEPGVYRKS